MKTAEPWIPLMVSRGLSPRPVWSGWAGRGGRRPWREEAAGPDQQTHPEVDTRLLPMKRPGASDRPPRWGRPGCPLRGQQEAPPSLALEPPLRKALPAPTHLSLGPLVGEWGGGSVAREVWEVSR